MPDPSLALPTNFSTAHGVMTLRPRTDADRAALREIYGSTRAEELARTDWPQAQRDAFIEHQFSAQDAHYRGHYPTLTEDLIELEEGGVKHVAGRLYLALAADELRIVDIALLPAFQRRGLGRLLLEALIAAAGRLEVPTRIHVERFNPALALYERLGFKLLVDRGVYLFLERPVG